MMDRSIIYKNLFDLKDSEEGYADFEIHCGGQIHKVHKALISATSPFFKAACGELLNEGQEGMINLPEDNPDAVTAMVRFIYLNEYTSNFYHDEQCKLRCEFAYPCASCISFLAHLYGLGEKYGITGLKDASGSSLGLALRLYPQKISFIAFQEAGKIIYSTTPDGERMRSTIADAIIQRSDLLTKSTFQQLMQTTPELARDVTLTLAKAKDEASRMLVEANSDRKDLKRQLNDSREQFRKRFRRNGTSDH